MTEQRTQRLRLTAAASSLVVGAILMLAKFWAWRITGSAAILSDALESIINVVAGGFAAFSVYLAAQPPDPEHPYGHGKIEYFSAGVEGALIVLAAAGIIWSAVPKLLNPTDIPSLDTGLAVVLGASLVNLVLGYALIRTGKATSSLTLVADGRHVMTDVYTSIGVVMGLVLVRLTGLAWLDPLTAILVGVNILRTGWELVRRSFDGLMNASDPELLDDICQTLQANRTSGMLDIHHLRAWRSGLTAHIDFHLVLPRDISLEDAHTEVKRLEAILTARFGPHSEVLIHVDPCIGAECPSCSVDECGTRSADPALNHLWRREYLTPNRRAADKLNHNS